MKQHKQNPRLAMVDVLRCAALAGMAVFHFCVDLALFNFIAPERVREGALLLLARVVAASFLFLAGFSLFLAHRNGIRYSAFRRRFLIIAGAALLVSLITYVMSPNDFVYFGILHEIAVASLAGLLFLRTPVLLNIVVMAVVCLLPGAVYIGDAPWLWWLGLAWLVRPSMDFVPFFPWFSAVLAGLTVARIMDTARILHWLRNGLPIEPLDRVMQWCGRHSLFIYLAHQPLLWGAVYAARLIAG
ncbi:MAG: Hypothetical protein BHV28_08420 [Candidatus Tokpelaia hoelldobleri]|uniref:Heparan-alpha-glucosaminide N-acetyltransferase catalytic domain-containing protein n=1 Tax=Candidatus Tokpelaia hoelldobleri TaxID=1902579 RepID=A0A1U9JUL1_9HYPH|nr:MAG: Hypothetical protein BHV28_08420 [Candidatus Tokpelaia hoelldoblerii]